MLRSCRESNSQVQGNSTVTLLYKKKLDLWIYLFFIHNIQRVNHTPTLCLLAGRVYLVKISTSSTITDGSLERHTLFEISFKSINQLHFVCVFPRIKQDHQIMMEALIKLINYFNLIIINCHFKTIGPLVNLQLFAFVYIFFFI